jgi:uncharacterized protein (TIGR04255 family)
MSEILKNKPLVETVFVLKWDLKKISAEDSTDESVYYDPYFKLLIGRFWDKIRERYPHFVELDTSEIPEDFGAYVPQFRFSAKPDGWPFVLLGPGIITIHDSDEYTWDEFKKQIFLVIESFFKSYPKVDETNIVEIYIRYVDAIKFNFNTEDIQQFLKEQMKIDISLNKSVFQNLTVNPIPQNFDFRLSYISTDPQSAIHLRFFRGSDEIRGNELVWETIVQTYVAIPQIEEDIKLWAIQSHKLADKIFFNMIEGKLYERFK